MNPIMGKKLSNLFRKWKDKAGRWLSGSRTCCAIISIRVPIPRTQGKNSGVMAHACDSSMGQVRTGSLAPDGLCPGSCPVSIFLF